jgi:hypothetical protein
VRGELVSIHVCGRAGAPLLQKDHADLIAGRGIQGDRYAAGLGEFSPPVQDPDHELTLIDLAEIERFNAESCAALDPGAFRRNLVTRGIDLNALVGAEFSIGPARLRGVRLCEPCASLARRTHPGVIRAMVHRAGLRAGIVRGGRIRVGDAVAGPIE